MSNNDPDMYYCLSMETTYRTTAAEYARVDSPVVLAPIAHGDYTCDDYREECASDYASGDACSPVFCNFCGAPLEV